MKILKNISFLGLVLVTFASCDLADPIESEITEYAEFEVTEGQYIYWEVGTPFQDPGVIAMAGEDELEVQISGSVDTNTPGVYVINYSALNSDGFPATTSRYVAVGNKEVAESRDLSGTYAVGTRFNTVSQMATPGFYSNSDVLPPNGIAVFMVDLGNGSLIVPPQSSPFGSVTTDPSVNADSYGLVNSENSFTLALKIGGNAIFTRTFTK